ncbi:MAG TPA: DUF979 family protein [Kofleriaceae bacterium]|nr:DUF979 family protein [Kofleriaceae bacterium]
MLTLSHVFLLLGALFLGAAILNLRERRWATAGFWAIVAVPLVAGDPILAAAKAGTRWPAQAMGAGVIALAVLATLGGRGGRRAPGAAAIAAANAAAIDAAAIDAAREASASRLRGWLFVPALAIPAIMIAVLRGAPYLTLRGAPLIDPAQVPLIALGLAATLALILALVVTRSQPIHGLTEGRRLLDSIGWAAVLPMLLATLGTVFTATGVGDAIAHLVGAVIPTDSRIACLVAYGLGMVVFTAIMGNAFAAFPVMTAGIGLPLLVHGHGANPAALGSLGMLTGYCGTLLTPMAANFNVVPVLLLELRDEYSVIRMQWPTAIALIATNLIVMSMVLF